MLQTARSTRSPGGIRLNTVSSGFTAGWCSEAPSTYSGLSEEVVLVHLHGNYSAVHLKREDYLTSI